MIIDYIEWIANEIDNVQRPLCQLFLTINIIGAICYFVYLDLSPYYIIIIMKSKTLFRIKIVISLNVNLKLESMQQWSLSISLNTTAQCNFIRNLINKAIEMNKNDFSLNRFNGWLSKRAVIIDWNDRTKSIALCSHNYLPMPMDLKETETELPECSWFGSFYYYYYLQPWLVVT